MFLKPARTTHPFFHSLGAALLDTLFPIRCLRCHRHGEWICADCREALPLRLDHLCPVCHRRPTPYGQTCFECAGKHALDGVFAASTYASPLLSHAIHTYKYGFVSDLARPLALFLASALRRFDLPLPDTIVPVPLHPRRLRFRGFNQSELLAVALAETLVPVLDIPILSDALVRTRFTRPQVKTESREERLANLQHAFAVVPGQEGTVCGRSVWLIDDISTTGATLEECARALKQAGAASVFGIVLAR